MSTPQPPAAESADQIRSRVWGRFAAEKRDLASLSLARNEMMRLGRSRFPDKAERQAWVYSELDRLYPPSGSVQEPPKAPEAAAEEPKAPKEEEAIDAAQVSTASSTDAELKAGDVSAAEVDGEPPVQAEPAGEVVSRETRPFARLPRKWPELPPTASLAVEIGWVQAERLRIVNQDGTIRLDRARSPAPSWSALAWLETSVRSYAKFVEVAAKVAGAGQDDQAQERQERMALDEVRSLLAEMQG